MEDPGAAVSCQRERGLESERQRHEGPVALVGVWVRQRRPPEVVPEYVGYGRRPPVVGMAEDVRIFLNGTAVVVGEAAAKGVKVEERGGSGTDLGGEVNVRDGMPPPSFSIGALLLWHPVRRKGAMHRFCV